jgi:hypothetical protein
MGSEAKETNLVCHPSGGERARRDTPSKPKSSGGDNEDEEESALAKTAPDGDRAISWATAAVWPRTGIF